MHYLTLIFGLPYGLAVRFVFVSFEFLYLLSFLELYFSYEIKPKTYPAFCFALESTSIPGLQNPGNTVLMCVDTILMCVCIYLVGKHWYYKEHTNTR